MMRWNTQSLLSLYMGGGVLFFSGFFIFLFDAENPTATYSIISAQFYFTSGIIIFKCRSEAVRYIVNAPCSLLICLLAMLSAFWSFQSSVTITRSIALIGTFCFALSLVVAFDWDKLLKVLIIPLLVSAVVSLFVSVFIPSIGIDNGSGALEHAGLWQGTFGFKNTLGRVMGLFAVVLLAQNILIKNYRNAFLVLTIFILLMSGSSTPIIAVIAILMFKFFLEARSHLDVYKRTALVIGVLYLTALLPTSIEYLVVDVLGKDLSGTGRVDMWIEILTNIDSPILGYGFGGGFWGEFGYANGLIDPRYVLLGHAHNGFVDTLIELGAFGVLFYFALLISAFFASVKNYRRYGNYYLLPLFLVIFFTIYSITGSAYIKQNNILFIFACLASFLPYKKVSNK